MGSLPKAPENVRALMADGREIPLECVYGGMVNGTHQWLAVPSLAELPTTLLIGALPAHTAVGLQWMRQ